MPSQRIAALAAGITLTIAALAGSVQVAHADPPPGPHGKPEEAPKLGLHWARDAAGAKQTGKPAPELAYHGGTIMTGTTVTPIFWGASWASAAAAADKPAGIDTFYGGVGGSPYLSTTVEYTGTNGSVGVGVATNAHVVDTAIAPNGGPSVSQIVAEVQKLVSQGKIAAPPTDGTGYYPVYVDAKRGNLGYCAWHSYGAVNGIAVQVGFFFNLDGDGGCDPGDTTATHSQGLEAIANVSGHELSEVLTDPRNGGWWDRSGQENADKCAWTFGASQLTFTNGSHWRVQGNWSNRAYLNHTGYTLGGCIDGH